MSDAWNSTWEGSKSLYSEYINTDPAVDLDKVEHARWEEKMARSLTPVDTQLTMMLRRLGLQSTVPDGAWVDSFMADFPWLGGCVVAGMDGEIMVQRPEMGMKPLNIQPFVDLGQEFKDRGMRAWFDDTPLGPEIYAAVPVFNGNELAGFVAAHFDMRNLMTLSDAPADLIVVTPQQVQWGGEYEAEAQELAPASLGRAAHGAGPGHGHPPGREFHLDGPLHRRQEHHLRHPVGDGFPRISWWTLGLF